MRAKGTGMPRTELLDQLLVLVEVLETIGILVVNAKRGGLLAVSGVTEHADAHLGTRDVRQLDVAGETLVLLRVIVLEANLKLNGLEELALLLLRALEDLVDAFTQLSGRDLRHAYSAGTRDDGISGRGAARKRDLRGA